MNHIIISWTSTILGLWFVPLYYLLTTKDERLKKHAKTGLIISIIEASIILYIYIDFIVLRYIT